MIEIRRFDPHAAERAEWAAAQTFRRAVAEENEPGEAVLSDQEWEREVRQEWPVWEERRWYAWREAEIVGVVGESYRRPGTADYEAHAAFTHGWASVLTRERRKGVASELLRTLHAFMSERDQRVVNLATHAPEGAAFLRAVGAELKHRQIENRAPFAATDWDMIARWRGLAISPKLRWEVYPHRAPLDRIEALLPQYAALQADMPIGELEGPRPLPEMSAWRVWYEELDRHGGDDMLALLMEGETIVALCEATWDARFPDRVFQMLTAVARPWRGRGLAKAIKAETMRLIRERHPDIRFVSTSNANVNAPMLAINTRLGFAKYRETSFYQIGVTAMADYLVRRAAS